MTLDRYIHPTTQDHYGHWDRCGLTGREHACIQLRVPESGDPELDSLIREAVRREMAGMAMQGLLAGAGSGFSHEAIADLAAIHADALLAALEASHD
jgi:hypothetical protein